MKADGVDGLLADVIGKEIAALSRIFYVFKGTVETRWGPIEIRFSDGSAITLDSGADGEGLRVDERWEDAFAEPLSDENRAFVARSGKWTAFDVSNEAPYRLLIGRAIKRIQPRVEPGGKITGARFYTDAGVIQADVVADELFVVVRETVEP